MSATLPPLMQESGMQFDLFIQALTEQLDKAQATMALKARVGKMPLTFAVKEVQLELRAFVQVIDDDLFVRPAGPGEAEASTIKLSLTTITKSMAEENAIDYSAEDPKFSLREALGDDFEKERRSLERIGVRTVSQLTELRKSAGADVIERLARMPVNRLQQAMMAAAAPRVGSISRQSLTNLVPGVTKTPALGTPSPDGGAQVQLTSPLLRFGRVPLVRAAGALVPVLETADGHAVLQPLATQLGAEADIDFGDGQVARVILSEGARGHWLDASHHASDTVGSSS